MSRMHGVSAAPVAILMAVALAPCMLQAGEPASGELCWRASGEGTWGGAVTNWFDGARAVAWTDGSAARFDGPGGRVTLAAPVTANGIRSTQGGYVIQTGKHPLTLTGDVDASVRLAVAKPQEDKNVGLGRPTVLTGSLLRFEGKAEDVRRFRGELLHPGGTVLVVDGCTLLFDGRADFPQGFLRVLLDRGGRFRIGASAWINNYTGADQNTREMVVHGDPQRPDECVFEIDAGFQADHCGFDPDAGQHGWAPHGFCQLSMRDVTFVTHSSRSLPGMLKRYRGRLIADAEVNFMGRCTWIVDTAHQVHRGTARSWRNLTIVTHKDLTVMASEQIPNSRFGDRSITKKGKGVLDVACRQFYYASKGIGQEAIAPVLNVEEGTLLMRTDPYEFKAGEGDLECVPPRVEIGASGRADFLTDSTIDSLTSSGTLTLARNGTLRIARNGVLKDTSVLRIARPLKIGKDGKGSLFVVQGDLELGGTLVVENEGGMKAGTYALFSVSGKRSGAFKAISLGAGLTGEVSEDGRLVVRVAEPPATSQVSPAPPPPTSPARVTAHDTE